MQKVASSILLATAGLCAGYLIAAKISSRSPVPGTVAAKSEAVEAIQPPMRQDAARMGEEAGARNAQGHQITAQELLVRCNKDRHRRAQAVGIPVVEVDIERSTAEDWARANRHLTMGQLRAMAAIADPPSCILYEARRLER